MKKVQLDKEREVKINFGVLEAFEDLSGVDAIAFNARNAKQLRIMLTLALKEADPKFDLTDKQVQEHMNLKVVEPLMEEFLRCTLGQAAYDKAKEEVGE
jgi:hypothetical protein